MNPEAAKKQPRRPESSSSGTSKPAKSRGRSKNGTESKPDSGISMEDDDSHLQPSTSSGSTSNSR